MSKGVFPLLFACLIFVPSCDLAPVKSDPNPAQNTVRSMADCGIDKAEYNRLLELSQKDFDQDIKGGWRIYSRKAGCKNAAAELIKSYILYSKPKPPERLGILRWHAGQLKAQSGKTDEAIDLFLGSYKDLDDHGDTWNLYVDATIGFLTEDIQSVKHAYQKLSEIEVPESLKDERRNFLAQNPDISMPDGFVEEPQNLSVVRGLLECFGQSYSEAYSGCTKT